MKKWIALYLFFSVLYVSCIALTFWALCKTPMSGGSNFILRVAAYSFMAQCFDLLAKSIKAIKKVYTDAKTDSAR